jgi:NACHT domain
VLDQIYHWIGIKESQHPANVAEDTRIFWINGSAGTGKTTIACTVAEACRTSGILGASFFCSRDDAECSNPSLIFTTIAYQLGQFCPSYGMEVARVLKSRPDIGYASVPYQLEELLLRPLQAVGHSFPPCVIVLDALDECKDSEATSIILSSLSRHVGQLLPFKILVTSRPERQITTAFQSDDLRPAAQRLVLHEIALGVVQHDIELYLAVNLNQTRRSYELRELWPSVEDIHALAQLSFGLFIFAATSVKFIEDRNYSNPKHQLAGLLHDRTRSATSLSSPYHYLDQLYTQVLFHAFPNLSTHLSGRLKMILGTIVFLRDPLSPFGIEQLLGLEPNSVRMALTHLHSIIIVPGDDAGVIRLLHPSFFDFITNPTRCRDAGFVVNTTRQHTLLAHACLFAMCNLRKDICGIKDASRLNSDVGDLPSRVISHIPLHVQYACRHWALHLANGMISDSLLDLLENFCSSYLLYWVEVCSLLGELRGALVSLDAAQKALAVRYFRFPLYLQRILTRS